MLGRTMLEIRHSLLAVLALCASLWSCGARSDLTCFPDCSGTRSPLDPLGGDDDTGSAGAGSVLPGTGGNGTGPSSASTGG